MIRHRNMNVVYLSSSIVPSRYANSVHVVKMCNAFSKWGHNVTLIAQRGQLSVGNPLAQYGVSSCFSLVTLPRKLNGPLGALEYTARLRNAAKRLSPDIYYARYVHGALAVARDNIPIVFESHAPPSSRLAILEQRILFKTASFRRLVVISAALKRMYIDAFPELDPTTIVVAHDGADLPDLPLGPPKPDREDGRLTVGYVGSLYQGRGLELIGQLADRLPTIDFHIVGGTSAEIRTWRKVLRHRNIVWHGFIPHGQLQPYFDRFDVLIAPYQRSVGLVKAGADTSRYMSPLKIFEYMAQGKPIIASNIPVLREVLNNEVNCLLCEPDDIDEWASALSRLAQDDLTRAKLGIAARESLKARYTWSARAKAVLTNIGG